MKAFVFLLLALITIIFFNTVDRFEVLDKKLLNDPLFHKIEQNWHYSKNKVFLEKREENSVKLISHNNEGITYFSQRVKKEDNFELLRLSLDAKTKNVVLADKHWKSARVVLIMYDKGNRPMYHFPHVLFSLHGENNWERYEKIFRINKNTEEVMIAAQLINVSGEMWVRNIRLESVKEKEIFIIYKISLALLWVLVILWIVASLIKHIVFSMTGFLTMFIIICIAVAVLLPQSIISVISMEISSDNIVAGLAEKYFEPAITLIKQANTTQEVTFSLYKFGHFCMFFILTFLLDLEKKFKITTIRLFCYTSILALGTEVLQLFSDGRTAQLSDFIIDISGIITALVVKSIYVAAKTR
ncbi:MAG: VanZ family protein [Candidatus Heimdallarchaeota archaeon]|nr:VanZ family protein [Candidatus Heimdallarchaeota archaeon]